MVDLADVLRDIDDALIALPEFQRDYDWDQRDVAALLVTVLKGWPAGSLLLMDGPARLFKLRGFDGGPEIEDDYVRYTVLDGQQRLTALYQALYDKGPSVYAVEASALEDPSVENLEEGVRAFKRAEWDSTYRGRGWGSNRRWVPMYVLASPSDYFAWRDELVSRAPAGHQDQLAAQLSSLYRHGLETVHRYKFPAVSVEPDLEPAAVARIFERVNKTGIELSAFDLMVARLYERDWNLRDMWTRARSDSALIDMFLGENGMPVLQSIAMHYVRNVRESAVLALPQPLVREHWEAAVDAVDAALSFLFSRCGVVRQDWLPYQGMILPLAALSFDVDLEDHEHLLRKWFWSRSFGVSYDAAANTRLVADFDALRRAISEEEPLEIPPASYTTLFESSRRRARAVWRAFLCLLAYRDAHDLDGQPLGFAEAARDLEPISEDVVVAPLFPRGVPTGRQSEDAHLRVLNLVLTRRATAKRLRSEWASQIATDATADVGDEAVRAALDSQFLPDRGTLAEIEETWRPILTTRLEGLEEFLSSEVGQSVERDRPARA